MEQEGDLSGSDYPALLGGFIFQGRTVGVLASGLHAYVLKIQICAHPVTKKSESSAGCGPRT